ncbi:hypothetical protein [Paraburkholderia bannensis]|uniref:hypothetical protein n=1 Tax=Paraburkholderia bannensis TaxID=765414 RepID=UPI00048587A9|nr:hypothetical protein [Paraburkholderia bannensis]
MSLISLRDSFATSAPSEIPKWFKHKPATPRPIVPVPREELSEEQYREWEGLGDWLDESDVGANVKGFDAKYRHAIAAVEAWDAEQRVAEFFAWRWYFADMMIATRGDA